MSRKVYLLVAVLVVAHVGVLTATTVGPATATRGLSDEIDRYSASDAASLRLTTSYGGDTSVPDQLRAVLAPLVDALGDTPPILVPPVGYSRHDDSDPLENDLRRTVYETVVDSPGTYLASVVSDAEEPASTVRYHVRILENEGLIETEMLWGKRRLFPAFTPNAELVVALNEEPLAAVVIAVHEREPAELSTLARAIDRSPSTVSYHLSRLEGEGLVAREYDGNSMRVSLVPSIRRAMDTGDYRHYVTSSR